MKTEYLPVPPAGAYTGWLDLDHDEDAGWPPVAPDRLHVEAVLAIKLITVSAPVHGREHRVEALTLTGASIASLHSGARVVVFGESAAVTLAALVQACAVERITRWLTAHGAHTDGRPPLADRTEREMFEAVRAGWLAVAGRG